MAITASAAAALNVSGVTTPVAVSDLAANVASYLDSLQTLAAASKLASIVLTDTTPTLTITATQLLGDSAALLKISSSYGLSLSGNVSAAQAALANGVLLSKLTTVITVTDSAANVVSNLAGLQTHIAKIGTITLTDTPPVVAISVTQMISNTAVLLKIAGSYAITLSGTATAAQFVGLNATLVAKLSTGAAISDTAANISSNIDSLQTLSSKIASVALTDTTPVLIITSTQLLADATVLLKIAGTYGITLSGNSTAAQAATANGVLLAKLTTGTTVSDSAVNVVSNFAGLLTHISKVTSITLTDTTPVLSITGTQLIADAAVLSKITSAYGITLSGSTTAAQAGLASADLLGKLTAGTAVVDSAANVVSNFAGLLLHLGSVTSISLTDTTPVLSISGTQLIADAAVLLKITSTYGITLLGPTTAAQAAQANAALMANLTAGITILDTAANVVSYFSGLLTNIGGIASITLADTTPVVSITNSQLIADAAVLLKIAGTYAITLIGTSTAAQATSSNNALSAKLTTGFAVSDTAANVAASLDALQANVATIASITVADGLPVAVTANQLSTDAAALLRVQGPLNLTVAGTVTAAQAVSVNSVLAGDVAGGLAISDTAANVIANLPALQSMVGSIGSITLSGTTPSLSITAAQLIADSALLLKIGGTSYQISVTGTATAAQATSASSTLVSKLNSGFVVSDVSANITSNIAALKTLADAGKLASITLTGGSPALTLTAAQAADTALNALLTGSYTLTISGGLTVTQLLALPANMKTNLVSAAVSGSTSDFSTNLPALQTLASHIGTVSLTGSPSSFAVTADLLANDPTILAKIAVGTPLVADSVNMALAASATSLGGAPAYTGTLLFNDSATNVQGNIDALQALATASHLGAITLTGGGTPTLTVSGTQLMADAAALSHISGAYSLTISPNAVNATQLAALVSTGVYLHVADHSLNVTDTSANVSANIATLKTLADAGTNKLAAIFLSDGSGSPAITLTATQASDPPLQTLLNLGYSYALAITGGLTVSQLLLLPGYMQTNLVNVALSGSASDFETNIAFLQGMASQISSVSLTGAPSSFAVTATQLGSDAGILGKIITSGVPLVGDTVNTSLAAAAATLGGAPVYTGTLLFTDSAANVVTYLTNLQALATASHLGAITLNDVGTPTVTVTGTQLMADGAALGKITNTLYTLAVSPTAVDSTHLAILVTNGVASHLAAASLAVSDTSGNVTSNIAMLQTLAAAGKLASITLTDPSPAISVTAATLVADATALATITTPSYALTVSSGTVTVAQLLALPTGLTAHVAAGLTIADSAANVAGSLNGLQALGNTVAAITLSDVPPVLSVTAAQLIADSALLLKIGGGYHISVTGTATAAQATGASSGLVGKLSSGFAISDTSANIVSNLTMLQTLAAAGSLASIVLTNTSPAISVTAATLIADATALATITSSYALTVSSGTVSAAQAVALPAMVTAQLVTGLAIVDSALGVTSSLDGLQALGAKVTSIVLTDTAPTVAITAATLLVDAGALGKIVTTYTLNVFSGTVTVAQLLALPVGVTTPLTGLLIADTASDVGANLAALQAVVGSIGTITLTDTTPVVAVTAAQLIADSALLLKIGGGYHISVTGTATAAQAAGASSGLVSVLSSGFVVSDVSANISSNLTMLQTLAAAGKLASIALTDTSPVISVTAAMLVADATALATITTPYALTVASGTSTVAQLLALPAGVIARLAGALIADTAANVGANLAALQAAVGSIGTITLTDTTPVVAVTAAQLIADSALLLKIAGSSYHISVTGTASVAQVVGTNSGLVNKLNSGFMISDVSANIPSNLTMLQTLAAAGKLASIALTDTSPVISVTAATLVADATALATITTPYALTVSSGTVTVAQLMALPSTVTARLTGALIADTAANVGANLAALQAVVGSISTITLTDTTPVVAVTAAQLIADSALLLKIGGSYHISVTGTATAAQAAGASSGLVSVLSSGFVVSDVSANISSNLTMLQTLAAAGKLASIALTDTSPVISVTAATLVADATALATITTPYALTVSSGTVTVAQLLALPAGVIARLAGALIADTAANVGANLAALQAAVGSIGTITLTDTTPVVAVTAAQLIADSALLLKIAGSSYHISVTGTASVAQVVGTSSSLLGSLSGSFAISDIAANVAGSIDALATRASSIGSITLTDTSNPLMLTATQFVADTTVLQKIVGSYSVTLSGTVTAAQAAAVSNTLASAVTGGLAVSDTAANVVAALAGMAANVGAIGSITLTGTMPVLSLTNAQLLADQAILVKIGSNYSITLSDYGTAVSAAQVASLSLGVLSHVSGQLLISDTPANFASNIDALQARNGAIQQVTLPPIFGTGANEVRITASQLIADASVVTKIVPAIFGVPGAVYVIVSDASVTAAQAATIIQIPNFFPLLGQGLTIADTAANVVSQLTILQSGLAYFDHILLTDTTPVVTISAGQLIADAGTLVKISSSYHIALSGSATAAQAAGANSTLVGKLASGFVISDIAANVNSNLDGLQTNAGSITSIALTDTSPVLTITATQLINDSVALLKITSPYSITVSGTALAAQVVNANATLLGMVTPNIAVSDTAAAISGVLDMLQTQVGSIASIALTGTSPVVTLTATQLINDATTLLKITGSYGIAVSGTATAAQAAGMNNTLAGKLTAALAVSDTAAAVGSILDGLQIHAASIASITLTGSTPVVTISAGQLVADAGTLGKIGSVYHIGVSGTATAAQAASANSALVAKLSSGFAIADTATNVSTNLDALQALVTPVASVSLTGSPGTFAVTATQLWHDAGILVTIQNGGVALVADGSHTSTAIAAANLGSAPAYTGNLMFTDTAAQVLLYLGSLQTLSTASHLGTITLTGTGTQTLNVTTAQLLADGGAIAQIAGSYNITIASGTLTATQAIGLSSSILSHLSAALPIYDSSSNVVSMLDQLQTIGSTIGSVTFSDSGTPSLSMTATRLIADRVVLQAVSGNFSLLISGTFTAAQASTLSTSTLASDLAVGAVVSDTAANIAAALPALLALTTPVNELGSITLTDSGTPTLTVAPAQLSADLAVLRKITSNYVFSSTGPLTVAQAVGISSQITSKLPSNLAVSDSSANVLANLDALQALAVASHLGSIALTDGGIPVLNVTADQLTSDAAALGVLTGTYQLHVIGAVTATQASYYASHLAALGSAVTVVDTAAAVALNIGGLGTLAANSLLTHIIFTDSGTPTLNLTGPAFAGGAAALATVNGTYNVTVSSALTVAQIAAVVTAGDLSVVNGTVAISDTAANVDGSQAALVALGSTLGTVTVTGSATAAQAVDIAANLSSHVAGTIAVGDTGANVVISLAGLQTNVAKIGTITLAVPGTPLSVTSAQLAADSAVFAKIASYTASVSDAITVATALSLSTSYTGHLTSAALTVSDTAANVDGSQAALVALGSTLGTVTVTGSATAAQAVDIAANLSSHVAGTIAVGDTGANVVISLAGLQTNVAKIGTITLAVPGTPLSVTSAQLAADSAVFAKIASYTASVSDAITVATALSLSTSYTGHLTSAALTVSDTAANVDGSQAALVALGSTLGTVTVTGSATAAQAVDIAANLSSHVAGTIAVGDTGANVVISLAGLQTNVAKIGTITLAVPGTPLSVTSAQLAADSAVFAKIASYTASVSDAITVATALSLSTSYTGHLTSAALTVSDTAANVDGSQAALVALGSTLGTVTVTGSATAAQAVDIAANLSSHVAGTIAVGDTGANVVISLAGLQTNVAKIGTITLAVPGTPLSVTSAQLAADSAVFAKIASYTASVSDAITVATALSLSTSYTGHLTSAALTVSDTAANVDGSQAALVALGSTLGTVTVTGSATAAQAVDIAANLSSHVAGTIAVGDTGANVVISLAGLQTNVAKIGTITLAVPGTPLSVTSAQLAADSAVFAKIASYTASVSDAITVATALSLSTSYTGHLTSAALTVSDTAANVDGSQAALVALGSTLGTVTVTGSATAAQAVDIAANLSSHVAGTIAVGDTGANVVTSLAGLQTNVAKIGTITLAVPGTPLSVTSAQLAADSAVFATIASYTASVSDAITVATALSLSTSYTGHLTSAALTVSDTAANVDGSQAALVALGSTLGTVTVTGSATAAQAVDIAANLSSHVAGTIAVGDTGANVVTSLAGLQTNVAKIGTITVSDVGTALSITATALVNDASALATIAGSYSLNVSSPTINAAAVTTLVNDGVDTHLATTLAVSDTATNLVSNLGALQKLHTDFSGNGLGAVTTTTSPRAYNVSAAQINADPDALSAVVGASGANPNASIYVQGTSGADTVSVSTLTNATNISLGTNTATMTFSSGTATITNTPDSITVGSSVASTINYTVGSGTEVITGFTFGLDVLDMAFNAVNPADLSASDVTVTFGGSSHSAVALVVSDNPTQGVLLITPGPNAATITSNYLSPAGSHVIVA